MGHNCLNPNSLLDSNTSQRVTISVLGHVAVSQMGIVQVPYATVTVKCLRALRYDLYIYPSEYAQLVFRGMW